MSINSSGNSNQENYIEEQVAILPFEDFPYTLQHRAVGYTKPCKSNKANLQ